MVPRKSQSVVHMLGLGFGIGPGHWYLAGVTSILWGYNLLCGKLQSWLPTSNLYQLAMLLLTVDRSNPKSPKASVIFLRPYVQLLTCT
jgi:hypothetical protein